MHIVIVGTGSIGSRHLKNIIHLCSNARFTFIRRSGSEDDLSRQYKATVLKDLTKDLFYDALIIANPSSHHGKYLESAIKSNRSCYVEKPVVTSLKECKNISSLIESSLYQAPSMVGCNLRYLPSLQKVLHFIQNGYIGKVVRVSLEAGKWLPDWRPLQDYKKSYSASKELGGGVIMDLIHEIDIARWMFGDALDYKAFAGKLSNLEIETEDSACIILSSKEGPLISINLDYVSRVPVRTYRFTGTLGTIEWDLNQQKALLKTPQTTQIITDDPHDFDVSLTYITAMKEFLEAISNNVETSQNLKDGLQTTQLALQIKDSVGL